MNVNVAATDERRIEVLAQDLPCFGGAQLAVDITLRCVLSSAGEPLPNTADVDGAALMVAREDKERIYPELTTSGRCRLVVVAIETGGRWSTEAVDSCDNCPSPKPGRCPPSCSSPQLSLGSDAGRGCCRLLAPCHLLPLWWNPLARA